jgi:hypothetical protein
MIVWICITGVPRFGYASLVFFRSRLGSHTEIGIWGIRAFANRRR